MSYQSRRTIDSMGGPEALGLLISLIVKGTYRLAKFIIASFKGYKYVRTRDGNMAQQAEETNRNETSGMPDVFSEKREIKPQLIRIIPFEGGIGSLTISVDRNTGQVKRKLNLDSPEYIKKAGGSRFRLTEITLTKAAMTDAGWLDNLVKQSVLDVSSLLAGLFNINRIPAAPAAADSTTQDNGAAKPSQKKATSPEKVAVIPAKTYKDKPVYVGVLTGFGMAERTKKEGKSGEVRTFSQFGLDYQDEQIGFTNRIWGADLERAATEANVKVGDRIRIVNHGRVQVTLTSGETSYKTAWEVTKL